MTTATKTRQKRTAPVYGLKTVGDSGEFEAIVSVFANVDFQRERVIAGAFTKSLERWGASGDPIPVIFSHRWDDPRAHIGEVLEAEELAPGDSRLPDAIRSLGGLWTRASLDIEKPPEQSYAAHLHGLMARRRLREFSFAYDVERERPGTEGASIDLLELDLIEVGPTLKGANPATELLAAKSFRDTLIDELYGDGAKADGVDYDRHLDDAILRAELVALSKGALNMGTEEATEPTTEEAEPEGAKTIIAGPPEGSIEAVRQEIYDVAVVWAGTEYGRELYDVHLEASFPDDNRAIVTAERWEDPIGVGPVWELTLERDDDDVLSVADATEVAVETVIRPKSAKRRGDRGMVTADADGKAEDRPGGKAEDRTPKLTPAKAAIEAARLSL